MNDLLIWIATISIGIAILVALVPLVPFLIGIAATIFMYWSLAKFFVFMTRKRW